eukprot:4512261-Amphidinium_carterae.1
MRKLPILQTHAHGEPTSCAGRPRLYERVVDVIHRYKFVLILVGIGNGLQEPEHAQTLSTEAVPAPGENKLTAA